jgi:membrane protease YdiL (CAAX protease family)
MLHNIPLVATAIWLGAVLIWFRRSTPVLSGGLILIGLGALAALPFGLAQPAAIGLGPPRSWLLTGAWAIGWLALMLAYSPMADWLASRVFAKPPTLGAFRAIQQSVMKLLAGIVIAWILGGFFEEIVFRGIVLNSIHGWTAASIGDGAAAILAIVLAALGAGIVHLYQGERAALIITQLSILFGALFVLSGYNLWAVILCHGLYDTIAFIRFARKQSKYSDLDRGGAAAQA